jgi:hypothetical protein
MRHLTLRRVRFGSYVITVMDGEEEGYEHAVPLLVSVEGPVLPSLRITERRPRILSPADIDTPEEIPLGHGLILFGSDKRDRPTLGRPRPTPRRRPPAPPPNPETKE